MKLPWVLVIFVIFVLACCIYFPLKQICRKFNFEFLNIRLENLDQKKSVEVQETADDYRGIEHMLG
jgi:hypothetical protein